MRVLINTIPLYGRTPGLRTYTAGLLGALHASDADMEWSVLLHPADRERLGLVGDARFRCLPFGATTRLSVVRGGRFVWRNGADQLLMSAMGARCDLMHYLDSYGPLLTRRGVPFALTVHDLLPLLPGQYFARWAKIYLAALMRATIPRARALMAVSGTTARQLSATFGIPAERIAVVPNGIDPRFRPCGASELQRVSQKYGLPTHYVIYAGSINPRKNIARLIRAFDRARRDHRLSHALVLVGALGWQYDDVLAAMREVNANSEPEVVRQIGHVPDEDIAPLIAGAQCLAYPSLEEGFGLPAVEAMACGTPVLASAIPSLTEVTGDAALLVDPRSEDAIADGLARLLGDATLRATLRERGLARASRFKWEAVARSVIGVYTAAARSLSEVSIAPDGS